MNHRQETFISEYITCGNATEAAIKAGYSKNTAYSIGQRLLKNVEIKRRIKTRQEQASNKAEVTTLQIIKEVRELAFSSKNESIKLKAYDMLLKHTGGYINEMQIIQKLSDSDLNALFEKIINKLPE